MPPLASKLSFVKKPRVVDRKLIPRGRVTTNIFNHSYSFVIKYRSFIDSNLNFSIISLQYFSPLISPVVGGENRRDLQKHEKLLSQFPSKAFPPLSQHQQVSETVGKSEYRNWWQHQLKAFSVYILVLVKREEDGSVHVCFSERKWRIKNVAPRRWFW